MKKNVAWTKIGGIICKKVSLDDKTLYIWSEQMKKIFNLFDSLKKAWSTSSFKKRTEEKFSGRSMIEMLCVLCVVVLLSLAAVKGWDYFEVRSRTNEVLDDLVTANASASTKRFTEKHNFAELCPAS